MDFCLVKSRATERNVRPGKEEAERKNTVWSHERNAKKK